MKYFNPQSAWDRREIEFREMERHKEMERDRVERERQQQQERERLDKQCNAEQAVTKHFEESLRRAKEKQMRSAWSLNTLPPQHSAQHINQHGILAHVVPPSVGMAQSQTNTTSPAQQLQEDRRRAAAEHDRMMAVEREQEQQRSYYVSQGIQRSVKSSATDYQSNQHRAMSIGPPKSVDKGQPIKPDPNVVAYPIYGYNYQQQYHKELKAKSELPIPPPLMSDIKQSSSGVIVKHDTHRQSPMQPVHSTKGQHNSHQSHYKTVPGSVQSSHLMFDYRMPTSIPSPNPIYIQQAAQLVHQQQQHQQQQQQQQQQHQQQQQQHHQQQQQQQQQHHQQQRNLESQVPHYGSSQTKPKVSSPAPSHIYGKPSGAGIVSGIPVCRPPPVEPPVHVVTKSASPSTFPSHVYAPPPVGPPPPAHSSRSMYDARMYPAPAVKQTISHPMHGTSPPTATAAQLPMSRSPGIIMLAPQQMPMSLSFQTQPLDLGVSDRNREDNISPKRKGTPMHHPAGSPISLDIKKKRVDSPRLQQSSPQQQPLPLALIVPVHQPNQPQTSSPVLGGTTVPVSEPPTSITPKPASEASGSDVPPSQSPNSIFSGSSQSLRTNSADGVVRPSSANSSPSPSPGSAQSAPATPAKFLSEQPEKSSSPALGAPRHLKKAWLQRHTGEDSEDTTGVTGSGSCLKLPITLSPSPVVTTTESSTSSTSTTTSNSATASPPLAHTFVSIGTMAVNSISASHITAKATVPPTKTQTAIKKPAVNNNGNNSDSEIKEDSSSSDQDRVTPPKRKISRGRRRKGTGRKPQEEKKKKPVSDSEKDSDSDNMSDKDSDSGTSTSQGKKPTNGSGASNSGKDKESARKRGRRPKGFKDEPLRKKRGGNPAKDPFRKPPVAQLKKTGESWLQDGPCFEVAPKLGKCRECRWTPNQRSKNTPNIFCRFYAFRRLRYTKNGLIATAGFSDPIKDPLEDDLKLWMPDDENPPKDLDLRMSRYLLAQVGDQFCDLYQQEKDAMSHHLSDDKVIAWKRVVQGVREMCDVCETTLFNYHWACGKCGFVVCLDCYKGRKVGDMKKWGDNKNNDRDEYSWLHCTNRAPHEQDRLMLTQIVAGDSLYALGRKVHEARALWGIPQYCDCPMSKEQPSKATNGVCKELIQSLIRGEPIRETINENGVKEEGTIPNGIKVDKEDDKSALSWLADVALSNEGKKNGGKEDTSKSNGGNEDDEDDDEHRSTLRELLIRPTGKPNGSRTSSPVPVVKPPKKNAAEVLAQLFSPVKPSWQSDEEEIQDIGRKFSYVNGRKSVRFMPSRMMLKTQSKELHAGVPHTWLCDGKMLRLLDPMNAGNYKIFTEQWKLGQPVIVSDVLKNLDKDLWRPDSFSRDFGEDKNDLINCLNGNVVPNQPMKRFWDGFDNVNKRLKDEKGQPMLLKLKDWPPGEDFAEILPSRFVDLMRNLPLSNYTQRTGRMNLASRLPDCFVKPDLGPKMYNAYGSALHPANGTTNLHLDISDAVNVMVYVGIPQDGNTDDAHVKEAYRAIDEAGCDILTRRRAREKQELPGALWHIYAPRDADKIRDLLNKVAIERGDKLIPKHDPIHDQSWYLDGPLRERLYREYAVEGYPIAQCLGDAVFIPAGAPHQVRNLHNCIKVAEDFVSPENITHCFNLTQEFRELSDSHSNHEDKLQIKNIIYHTVKDAVACLSHLLGQRVGESQGIDVNVDMKKDVKEEKVESE